MTATRRSYRTRPEDIVPHAWTKPWTPTEDEMTTLFLDIAQAKGWIVRIHVHDSRRMDWRSTPGMADWFMVNVEQRRTMWVEMKGYAGVASDEQRDFLAAVNDAGGEAYLVGTSGDYAKDCAAIGELLSGRLR